MQRCVFLLWWMYLTRVDVYRQHRCFSFCVCVVLQWFLKNGKVVQCALLRWPWNNRCIYIYIFKHMIFIYAQAISYISSAYTFSILFDNSSCFRHPRFAYCWNLRSHRKLRKMSSKCSGCSGYYRIKVSSTQLNPRQISEISDYFLFLWHRLHVAALVCFKKEEVGGNITRMWFHICSCNENNDHKTIR